MLPETIYKKKEGISSRRLGADLMLYDEAQDKIHILNETGALIWELLNSRNNIPGIEKTLLVKYPDTAVEEITKDVNSAIQKLLSEGLITCT